MPTNVTPEQLSVAIGGVQLAEAPQVPVETGSEILPGQTPRTGWVLSETVTVNEQEAIFPSASVTWYVSVVVPIGNRPPDPKPLVRMVVAPGQLSVPDGTG